MYFQLDDIHVYIIVYMQYTLMGPLVSATTRKNVKFNIKI